MIGQRQVVIMTVFLPKVRSLKAKILQVQILSKFKFSKKFFWDISKILFAIGNGIKRGFQINKNFPCRLRTLKIIDIFPNFWAAHTEAELNLENILSGYGGCFSRFLFGVQGLKGGSIGFSKALKTQFDPMCRYSIFAPGYRYMGIQTTFDYKLFATVCHHPRLKIYKISMKHTLATIYKNSHKKKSKYIKLHSKVITLRTSNYDVQSGNLLWSGHSFFHSD